MKKIACARLNLIWKLNEEEIGNAAPFVNQVTQCLVMTSSLGTLDLRWCFFFSVLSEVRLLSQLIKSHPINSGSLIPGWVL